MSHETRAKYLDAIRRCDAAFRRYADSGFSIAFRDEFRHHYQFKLQCHREVQHAKP